VAEPIVIVGANLTGGTAALTLREAGFDGHIVLIGAETHPPYERPPLSKEYLRGEKPFEKALLKPADHYGSIGIETRFGTVATRIDVESRRVELAGGALIPYDKVLVATGGRNRRFPIPGLDLDGVFDLRTVDDAERIRSAAAEARSAVVVGMGFIGAEVTASLRALGLDVTVVEPLPAPLFRVLGEDVGRSIEALHGDHGVNMIFSDSVESFEGNGRVERVVTKGGLRLDCDLSIVGVGIEPVTDVVAGTGVELENGIVVDERCRTNVEGIYAAGDVANHFHPVFGRRMRVEHWQNAMRHGAHAARSMLGADDPYEEIHWFWSDQYDANLQYAGHHMAWERLVVRGSIPDRNFVAFYVNGGIVDAAAGLNRGRDVRRAMGIIKARTPVDEAKLADETVDLRTLAG
jgi:3-phenylpropionate/trans-cinnamate dioxygenase ferredoxin reductase subunit